MIVRGIVGGTIGERRKRASGGARGHHSGPFPAPSRSEPWRKRRGGLAVEAGRAEPDRGFRKGALQAANAQLEAPGLAAAIARAASIKSAPKRREALIPLLTRRGAWSELAAVLEEIPRQDELFEAVHGVLFRLPGGSRLA